MTRSVFHRIAQATCLLMLLTGGAKAEADALDLNVEISYELFKLDNGLTVIVHEDHKAPVVAVNIWYHVGSKDEVRGKTGYAHLFEHIMFNGSENHDNDYFKATEKLGATNMNGTTSTDRTNYFQTVPKNAFDAILWLESDRMGNLLGAVTQEKLDEQRGVVKNEKRQNYDNRPYGKGAEIQYSSIYPHSHPYSWLTIGSMEDLEAATLEDMHTWFKTYYGAANAVLVIAGDVSIDEVKQKVEHYFGDIDPGPPLVKHQSWVAKLTGTQKEIAYDRVPQTMMMKSWNIEGNTTRDTNLLDMVSLIMSAGKSSRLYQRLVYNEQLVSDVSAYTAAREIAGTFEITARILPGVDEAKVDGIIGEELARFIKDGPTRGELEQVKIQLISGFVKGLEQLGGFGGKADILASNYVYTGNPHHYLKEWEWIRSATRQDLKEVAGRWLSDGLYQLEIRPFPRLQASTESPDRSGIPEPGEPPLAKFDDFERVTLDNGMNVILAERDAIPVVNLALSVDAGYASDQFSRAGVARLAMNMMDEGTDSRDALDISDELITLGATLGTSSNLDTSTVSMSTLSTTLDDALELFSDVVLNPAFPEKEMERLRTQQLTGIQREKTSPNAMAGRVLPGLIFGDDHAYSNPLAGSGTIESTKSITLDELRAFHDTWFKPNQATLIIVGDTTMEEVLPQLQKRFGKWKSGDVPVKSLRTVERRDKLDIYIVDRPGSPQSLLLGAIVATPRANNHEPAIQAMNDIIGGNFISRLNLNLREDKGWSYGVGSAVIAAKGQRIFYMLTSVQQDKTAESIAEAMNEFSMFISDAPPTQEEVADVIDNRALSLTGRWQTSGAVLSSLNQIVTYNLPDDYYDRYPAEVQALTPEKVSKAAQEIIHPNNLVWVVVGDRSMVETPLEALGYGPIKVIDTDGQVIED